MSLNEAQQKATSAELAANCGLSGLSRGHIASDLGLTSGQLDEIFDVAGARPEDVWWLRDYLERAVIEAGAEPLPYTSLTPQMRASAELWFPLRTPPQVTRAS